MKLADISGTQNKDYQKVKIDELETNSKIKNIRNIYTGIKILGRVTGLGLIK